MLIVACTSVRLIVACTSVSMDTLTLFVVVSSLNNQLCYSCGVNMAAALAVCTIQEQNAVICLSWADSVTGAEIHWRLSTMWKRCFTKAKCLHFFFFCCTWDILLWCISDNREINTNNHNCVLYWFTVCYLATCYDHFKKQLSGSVKYLKIITYNTMECLIFM